MTGDAPPAYLVILGDPRGLRFVLNERRMAFASASPRGGAPGPGDRLLLYVTGSCWGGGVHHPGRVVGVATPTRGVQRLDESLLIGGRRYHSDLPLEIRSLAPLGLGPALRDLVPQMSVFPSARTYTTRLRQPVLQLPDADSRLLERLVCADAGSDLNEAVNGYLNACEQRIARLRARGRAM